MKMDQKEKKRISFQIKCDIENGIYKDFPRLKDRLSYIGNKLFNSCYIINTEMQLTNGELQTLKENDYIEVII